MKRLTALRRALIALSFTVPVAAHAGAFSNIYTFGDSLSDQGNLYIATDAILDSFLGEGDNGIPRADIYWQGRFADGENWLDVLASELDAQSTPSLLGGMNFAFGGTRLDYNTVEENDDKPEAVQELADQLPWSQGGAFPTGAFDWTLDRQRQAFVDRPERRKSVLLLSSQRLILAR